MCIRDRIDPTTPEQFSRAAAQEAERILAKARAAADAAGVSSSADTQVSEVPYEAIIEAVERNQCDLIFMASHGRRGLRGLLLGSETQKVLTHSKIPVLVYRWASRIRMQKGLAAGEAFLLLHTDTFVGTLIPLVRCALIDFSSGSPKEKRHQA